MTLNLVHFLTEKSVGKQIMSCRKLHVLYLFHQVSFNSLTKHNAIHNSKCINTENFFVLALLMFMFAINCVQDWNSFGHLHLKTLNDLLLATWELRHYIHTIMNSLLSKAIGWCYEITIHCHCETNKDSTPSSHDASVTHIYISPLLKVK